VEQMRFFHTADIHLGAFPDSDFPWGEERRTEIWESFRRLIQKAENEKIDLLLIAGDLFHRQPLMRELKELNYLFGKLTKTKVVLIAGNHDYLKQDSYYRTFEWNKNVTFLYGPACEKKTILDLNTEIYGFSYHTREITERLYDKLQPEPTEALTILLAHGGDEKHIPLDKKRLQMSDFDYIALGHIHKPQILTEDRMIYAGALEPLDKNDTGVHGFISGKYENGTLTTEFIPWALREYIHLEITCDASTTNFALKEKISDLIERKGSHHIYKITILGLRDPDIIFDTFSYMQIGNVIEVIDISEPAYDFERLEQQNRENIVGHYIRKLYRPEMKDIEAPCGHIGCPESTDINMEKKALYYGIQALLEAQR